MLLLFLFLMVAGASSQGQYLGHSFHADATRGGKLFSAACASCHGRDGKVAPQAIAGFQQPRTFPDFTRCDQTTPEVDSAYKDVIEHGGPSRGFSQIMPAFDQALSAQDVNDLVAYLRSFCKARHWPRGELNLPRAIVTEKAFPEDELVISTSVNVNGTPGNTTHIIHEQSFGKKNQIEVDVPIEFENQNHIWYGGVGDTTLALKRVMFSDLDSGSILSLQGGFLLPVGNRSRGFGAGTTTFETFAAFDQLFRSDTFIQTQFGADLPFKTTIAPQSWFFNTAIGQSFAANHGLGRLWTPMFEFLASRDLTTGAKTDWDVLPEMQVTISRRQHIRGDLGLQIPAANTAGRQKRIVFYLLWDWADGRLSEGW
ncbi:MAG TPA: cytochrome c [Candidatus Eisenbacteria bacterium]|nr:cytochrome c [Candidatus Eisenbacteria bacterium]